MVKQTTYRWVTVGILALIVILIGVVLYMNDGFGINPSSSARSAVEEFGTKLQSVSLLAPDATSTMASLYGSFVTPQLLEMWQASPKDAPGRVTSSPYPDHIEIAKISRQGSGYIVNGTVVYMTSDGEAGRAPVVIQVIPHDGEWLIAAYEEQALESAGE